MGFMRRRIALVILSSCVAGCTGRAAVPSDAGAGLGGAAEAGSGGSAGGTPGGAAGTGGTGGAAGQAEYLAPETAPCEGTSSMVGARLKDGDCFKIDSRPVTRGDWRAYEEETGGWVTGTICEREGGTAPRLMPPRGEEGHNMNPDDLCWDNSIDDLHPDPGLLHWPPSAEEEALPMVCVTWCQAALYCEKRGKSLCAPLELRSADVDIYSGEELLAPFGEAERNEWFAACSAEGTRPYPYGTGLIKDACPSCPGPNGDDYHDWSFKGWATASYDATCQGGYQGLYLMGALREWTATCYDAVPGLRDSACFAPTGACDVDSGRELVEKRETRGDLTFRCCSR